MFKMLIALALICVVGIAESQSPDANHTDTIPEGAIRGLFSISPTQKVYFSRGNLQFCHAKGTHMTADGRELKGTWRFAPKQYDYIGIGEKHDALVSKDGYFDSFGWATSGYDNTKRDSAATNFQPWSPCVYEVKKTKDIPGRKAKSDDETTTLYHSDGFGPTYNKNRNNNITGKNQYYDWGLYNAISNGGNAPGMWRLLTAEEVIYLFLKRQNAFKLSSVGTVDGHKGLILLPDDWNENDATEFISFDSLKFKIESHLVVFVQNNNKMIYPKGKDIDFYRNVYTPAQWEKMENRGALFLSGPFWTSTSLSATDAITFCALIIKDIYSSLNIDASNIQEYIDVLNQSNKTGKPHIRLVSVYEYNVDNTKK